MAFDDISPLKTGEIADLLRIKHGSHFKIKEHRTDWHGLKPLKHLSRDDLKEQAREHVDHNLKSLSMAQERLYANDVYSLLIVFQAMDAAGKDGMIKHVMAGLNPQGCQVFSFKKPSDEELDHNFLWRYSKALPERGRIGIFNRSYYEETLVVRVHPELLERQRLPSGKRGSKFWDDRYEDINNFERHLTRNGTILLKFFLHMSKQEQKKRFLDRLNTPEKYWKFSAADLEERRYWDDYQCAFQDTIRATSTKWAPWYVIPSDHKWIARAAVSAIIRDEVESMCLKTPKPTKEELAILAQARKKLEREQQ